MDLVASITINPFEVTTSVASFELSTKFIERFTKIVMLNIIKRRIQIPETEFLPKIAFDEIPYFVFHRQSQNPFISRAFKSYSIGITDALVKGFLKEWQILIVSKSTKKILECYIYKYQYNLKKKGQSGNKDPEKVRKAMLHNFSFIEVLPGDKWPENDVELLCEISYHESTPATYEPPYFGGPSKDIMSDDHLFESMPIGKINTGFHKMYGYGKGVNFEAFRVAERLASEAAAVAVEQQSLEEKRVSLEIEPKINKRGSVDEIVENPSKKSKLVLNESSKIPSPVSSEASEVCVCGWRNLDDRSELLKCNKCGQLVHSVCNGFFKLKDIDAKKIICRSCSLRQSENSANNY